MSVGSKMLTETGFRNYWHDMCVLGESKMFETDTGLMNNRHDRCLLSDSKMFKIETSLMNY